MNKKGFTLLELLITATLISILAALAMSSYRQTAFKSRLEDFKNRTRAVSYAVQIFREEYPRATGFDETSLVSISPVQSGCKTVGEVDPASLIHCNILDGNREWSNSDFAVIVPCSAEKSQHIANSPCDKSARNDMLACMRVLDEPKVPSEYRGYVFCVSAGKEEEF